MNQTTIFDAIAARDAAMNQVAANNEEHNAGWQRLALAFMRQFYRTHASFFPWEVERLSTAWATCNQRTLAHGARCTARPLRKGLSSAARKQRSTRTATQQ